MCGGQQGGWEPHGDRQAPSEGWDRAGWSPLPLRLQEAGDGEGWQAARVARRAAMAAWFVQVGVQVRRRAGNGMGRRNTACFYQHPMQFVGPLLQFRLLRPC